MGNSHDNSGLLTNSSIHDAKVKKMRLPIEAGREWRDR